MPEYIELKALKAPFDAITVECNGETFVRALDIQNFVSNIKPADVAPVVHGRWECGKPCPICGEDRFKGLDADIWADWEPPNCPNCGAKMDGGESNA